MRVLVVTNLVPDQATPQRGRWVRDQVAEIRARGIEGEEFGFPRGRSHYLPATRRLRALLRAERFDLVHAHYGLAGWVARLAGARPLLVTFHGTDVRPPVLRPLSRRLTWRPPPAPGRSPAPSSRGRPAAPPCPPSPAPPSSPAGPSSAASPRPPAPRRAPPSASTPP